MDATRSSDNSPNNALGCDDIRQRLQDCDEDSIPLADDDPSAVVDDQDDLDLSSEAERRAAKWRRGCESLDSIPSMISDSLGPPICGSGSTSGGPSSPWELV